MESLFRIQYIVDEFQLIANLYVETAQPRPRVTSNNTV